MKSIRVATVECLQRWALGLPWVVERPGMAEAPELRWFGLECPPLGTRRLWMLTGTLGEFPTEEPEIMVVVPRDTAEEIVTAGHGTVVATVGPEDNLVSFRLDATDPDDTVRMQGTVLIAYDACFSKRRSDCLEPPSQ